MTTFEAVKPLEPGKAVEVFERDESGFLVGAWFGYWNYNRQTVALYPNVKNRFVNWPGGKIPSCRIVVSDRNVVIRNAKCEMTAHPSVMLTTSPKAEDFKAEGYVKQERMDI